MPVRLGFGFSVLELGVDQVSVLELEVDQGLESTREGGG